jgi:uncharacterized membrane protein YcaP (DUF421 family)
MEIVLRATVMFAIVYLLVRVLGKRELGQMTPFEFIVMVVIGDLIQQGITQNDFSITGATLAICTFAFWGLVLSWFSYLSPRAARLLEGEPRVIVRHGEVLQHSLKRDRLTIAEIQSEMRLAGIAQLSEVEWAVLEPNGKISFIKAEGSAEPAAQKDEASAA